MAARSGSDTGAARCCAAKFFAQVHDSYFRERPVFDARRQLKQLIFSRARVVKAFERRRRRAEQRHRAFELRAIHGDIAAVIARRFLLLVARLLLLVHDDQAEIFERRENRGARSHHHARLAVPHAPPFARALDFRQAAVQHRDARAESRADQPADPQRQRNFRNQNNGRLAARERRFDGAQINFRFAAAGDAVKKRRGEFAGDEPAPDFRERAFLVGVQNIRRRSEIRVPGVFFDA